MHEVSHKPSSRDCRAESTICCNALSKGPFRIRKGRCAAALKWGVSRASYDRIQTACGRFGRFNTWQVLLRVLPSNTASLLSCGACDPCAVACATRCTARSGARRFCLHSTNVQEFAGKSHCIQVQRTTQRSAKARLIQKLYNDSAIAYERTCELLPKAYLNVCCQCATGLYTASKSHHGEGSSGLSKASHNPSDEPGLCCGESRRAGSASCILLHRTLSERHSCTAWDTHSLQSYGAGMSPFRLSVCSTLQAEVVFACSATESSKSAGSYISYQWCAW